MSIHVKICGVTDSKAAWASVEAGADAIGFVFHPGSVRRVSPSRAQSISVDLPENVEKVAVFLRPTLGEIRAVLDVFDADLIQADVASVRNVYNIRTLPVLRMGPDLESDLEEHDGGRFLLEGSRSGVGEQIDWTRASDFAARGRMTLAGGLDPRSVAEAIRTARPFGVDVSSGVESQPGVKDPRRIREFVERVRETELEMLRT